MILFLSKPQICSSVYIRIITVKYVSNIVIILDFGFQDVRFFTILDFNGVQNGFAVSDLKILNL
jgi:hypothetical protein